MKSHKHTAKFSNGCDEYDLPRVGDDGCYVLPNGECVGCPHCIHARPTLIAAIDVIDALGWPLSVRARKEIAMAILALCFREHRA